ncbi:Dehydrogenase/reductase SDR family member 1 [Thelohanellus kitauei]|uniref:Dehydrogenase/reductase SDR family member 1 n=1 Tax=Thelohanellus kitauei TaxID=669202 RepID=A0A0C2N419_THEKT|nr:Dehydrogenase/reductase SDR family member 1 [Thelohanellus kitauei]
MAVEMGQELKSHGITVVSLWPGLVRTEILTKLYKEGKLESLGQLWQYSESVEFTGRAIAHLSADKDVIQNTGKILIVAELANKYGFSDIDGKYPPSLFAIKCFVGRYLPSISSYIPNFFRVPKSLATWYYGKF